MPKMFLFSLILISVTTVACSKQVQPSQTASVNAPSPGVILATPTPAYNPLDSEMPDGFVRAWNSFLKDGRYRLAQHQDILNRPYHYDWDHQLLAIVVDSKSSDAQPLRLVFFAVPKKGDKGDFKQHWVIHNFDLTKAELGHASSQLTISETAENGERKSCSLEWDVKRNAYTCLSRNGKR